MIPHVKWDTAPTTSGGNAARWAPHSAIDAARLMLNLQISRKGGVPLPTDSPSHLLRPPCKPVEGRRQRAPRPYHPPSRTDGGTRPRGSLALGCRWRLGRAKLQRTKLWYPHGRASSRRAAAVYVPPQLICYLPKMARRRYRAPCTTTGVMGAMGPAVCAAEYPASSRSFRVSGRGASPLPSPPTPRSRPMPFAR